MESHVSDAIRPYKHALRGAEDLEALADDLAEKKVVMLGESSHGTHEYYLWRARLSRILIQKHGFDFIAVEGDWPACYRLNRYVKNYADAEGDLHAAMAQFDRWPTWMWANWEVFELAEWMRRYNRNRPRDGQAGFYGLDAYSLRESLEAIMDYLDREDPAALETAHRAARCFEPYRGDIGREYSLSTRLVPEGCQTEVVEMLGEILRKQPMYNHDREHVFSTEQNAHVVHKAEEYYRVMMLGNGSTWNIRDRHMHDTLKRLFDFHGAEAKGIVWAHNTHIGDASYTDMADDDLFNIGQLARGDFGEDRVSLVGFGSHRGTVMAGSSWGAPAEVMELPESKPESWERVCHQVGGDFYVFSEDLEGLDELRNRIPHRAVGVVYHPSRDRIGNYAPTVVPRRYDAFVFIDQTKAVHAFPTSSDQRETPETFPFGV